jgi:hypothetical protein
MWWQQRDRDEQFPVCQAGQTSRAAASGARTARRSGLARGPRRTRENHNKPAGTAPDRTGIIDDRRHAIPITGGGRRHNHEREK